MPDAPDLVLCLKLCRHNPSDPTDENSKQIQVISIKRGKTRARKLRLVLVFLLDGLESDASFCNQSQSVVKGNAKNKQTNKQKYFAKLKTAVSRQLILVA